MTDIERLQTKGISQTDRTILEKIFTRLEIAPSSGQLVINYSGGRITHIQPTFKIGFPPED